MPFPARSDGRGSCPVHAIDNHEAIDNVEMILEVAILSVKPGEAGAFEAAFGKAQAIIAASPGYISHELQRCVETPDRYILLVRWRTIEDHTVGFRQSAPYREWRRLLHRFYDPFPTVEHYEPVCGSSSSGNTA